MAVPAAGPDARDRVKKSVELDRGVDDGLKEIARFQFRPQISVINDVLRDYVASTLPEIRQKRAEQAERLRQ